MPRKINEYQSEERNEKKRKEEGKGRKTERKREQMEDKAKRTKRNGVAVSGRVGFYGVGRERASRRRLVERGCLSLIKISRKTRPPRENLLLLSSPFRCCSLGLSLSLSLFLPFSPLSRSLQHCSSLCRVEFLIFNYPPVLLISCAWPLGRDCRREQ